MLIKGRRGVALVSGACPEEVLNTEENFGKTLVYIPLEAALGRENEEVE